MNGKLKNFRKKYKRKIISKIWYDWVDTQSQLKLKNQMDIYYLLWWIWRDLNNNFKWVKKYQYLNYNLFYYFTFNI